MSHHEKNKFSFSKTTNIENFNQFMLQDLQLLWSSQLRGGSESTDDTILRQDNSNAFLLDPTF